MAKTSASAKASQEMLDVESCIAGTAYLNNSDVKTLSWSGINVTVPDRKTKQPKRILEDVDGHLQAGEIMAIMGPSGSGKTTLLNVLAHREASAKAHVHSKILINDRQASLSSVRNLSRYVESTDTLIGSLTVKETLYFAARLSLPRGATRVERDQRIDELLSAFGLTHQADEIIGTLIKKGISTGQKRRLSVASQLMSAPRILFLDEPTSGLDSAASFKVISYIKEVARANNLLVIASIHQPSTTTFDLFDKVLLLSEGKTCYFGETCNVKQYFDGVGFPMPTFINPADFILNLINVDFERDIGNARANLTRIHTAWQSSKLSPSVLVPAGKGLPDSVNEAITNNESSSVHAKAAGRSTFSTTWTILHRSWIKSRRDILVYGVRFCMYMGLAVMMGTVWLRLKPTQDNIQPLENCIFFGSAFMSFMAVVYVPAFIEDRTVYVKDRANGLYGSTAFMVSNFIVGLPYLFVIALASSSFLYWMVNFRPEGTAFATWVMWMYLNLIAAESLVVLMSCLFPNFVGALALTAMVNGLWMACNGFLVPLPTLNVFYRYVFYYINYQSYVFRGLVTNEFGYRDYSCGEGCYCHFDTSLRDQCLVAGPEVLQQQFGYLVGGQGKWVGIMLGIIAVTRLMGWMAMAWRK